MTRAAWTSPTPPRCVKRVRRKDVLRESTHMKLRKVYTGPEGQRAVPGDRGGALKRAHRDCVIGTSTIMTMLTVS